MSALPPLLLRGDCLREPKLIPDASVDAVVTDPPYGLGFMGQKWDTYANETGRRPPGRHTFDHVGGNHNPSNAADQARTRRVEDQKFQAWCELWATECLRILKPGGHMLAFGGTRTWHRLTSGVEDAGFEIRDSIAWLYGSGFPKSMNLGNKLPEWDGWGTALKPAFEPVIVARKPFPGTVAANVLEQGTGALNIDATRIEHANKADLATSLAKNPGRDDAVTSGVYGAGRPQQSVSTSGRWPANVVLDDSQAAALDEQSGYMKDGVSVNRNRNADEIANEIYGARKKPIQDAGYGSGGGASRFFYVAKAPKSERPVVDGTAHPTVKPLALMRWLLRLVTPPRGVIVDPFAGSGTTLEAAYLEDFDAIGVEMTSDYWPLIEARIARVTS